MDHNKFKHFQNLNILCRLCGDKVKKSNCKRGPFPCKPHTVTVKKYFGIDLDEDDPKIHPKYLCMLCYKRVSNQRLENTSFERFQDSDLRRQAINLNDNFRKFEQNEHCWICTGKTIRGTGAKKKRSALSHARWSHIPPNLDLDLDQTSDIREHVVDYHGEADSDTELGNMAPRPRPEGMEDQNHNQGSLQPPQQPPQQLVPDPLDDDIPEPDILNIAMVSFYSVLSI